MRIHVCNWSDSQPENTAETGSLRWGQGANSRHLEEVKCHGCWKDYFIIERTTSNLAGMGLVWVEWYCISRPIWQRFINNWQKESERMEVGSEQINILSSMQIPMQWIKITPASDGSFEISTLKGLWCSDKWSNALYKMVQQDNSSNNLGWSWKKQRDLFPSIRLLLKISKRRSFGILLNGSSWFNFYLSFVLFQSV